MRLDAGKRSGAAIIRQIDSDGPFGLFKLEMRGTQSVPVRAKILLQ
jgi:hypothetical protein